MNNTQKTVLKPAGSEHANVGKTLRAYSMVIVLVVIAVLFHLLTNGLIFTAMNLTNIILQNSYVVLLILGMLPVILTGNVDLSVGSILGCTAFATGFLFATNPGLPIVVVFIAGIVLGALLGALNGALVTQAKVPAMVITLGTLYVFRGGLNWWAGSTQYFAGDRPQAFGDLGVATIGGFPLLTLLAVVVIVIVSLYQRYARSGRDLYAIGSDRTAAAVYGIPVAKRVFMAFVVNGALVGLGGVLYASRFNSVGATTGAGMELDIVAACVVGGVAMTGGVGTAYGAAIGALLLTTMTSALTAVGVDKFWQKAVVGALILIAIVVDRVSSMRRHEALRKKGADR